MPLVNSYQPKNLPPAPMIPKSVPNPALAILRQRINSIQNQQIANQPQTGQLSQPNYQISASPINSNSINWSTLTNNQTITVSGSYSGTSVGSVVYPSNYYNIPVQGGGTIVSTNYLPQNNPSFDYLQVTGDKLKLPGNRELVVEMPDGSVILLDKLGNFIINDKNARVTYQANRMRAFNPFINASDLLAEFIKYLATLNLKKSEVQTLPLGLFINWLIIRAAETDMDPIPADVVPVPQHKLLKGRIMPRCLYDQRYVERELARKGWQFCNPLCADKFHRKLLAA